MRFTTRLRCFNSLKESIYTEMVRRVGSEVHLAVRFAIDQGPGMLWGLKHPVHICVIEEIRDLYEGSYPIWAEVDMTQL